MTTTADRSGSFLCLLGTVPERYRTREVCPGGDLRKRDHDYGGRLPHMPIAEQRTSSREDVIARRDLTL
jgi:hypothetical protein